MAFPAFAQRTVQSPFNRGPLKAALAAGAAAGALAAWSGEARAQDQCGALGLLGEVQCDIAEVTGGVDYDNPGGPVDVEILDGASPVGGVSLNSLGDATVNAASDSLITSTGEPGLGITSADGITARIGGVQTTGSSAPAAALQAADDILVEAQGPLGAEGPLSPGLRAAGRSADITLTTVDTEGDEAPGVDVLATDGGIDLTADAIRTDGALSPATVLEASGPTSFDIGLVETQGTEAAGVDVSADPTACVLLGPGGCDVDGSVGELTTNGFGGVGALVRGAGGVNLGVDTLSTGGDQAAGADIGLDPDACLALGVGACDTAFTSGELVTAGDDSTGVVIRGVGDVTTDIGVLRTGGDEAAGADIATDPAACAVLGAGACDTSFTAGELTTLGDGSPGALIAGAGDITADVGALSTQGDDSAGLDLASSPEACVLLGEGGCDITALGDSVETGGDGSAGVLIDAAGDVLADFGALSTDGDDSAALDIVTDPAVCLTVGDGVCAVQAQADDVDTDGDNSDGVNVDNDGPNDVDVGDVQTDGDDSDGVEVDGGDGPTTVDFDTIETNGDDSEGVDVSGDGAITVRGGSVTTNGDGSEGVLVDGGAGKVTIDVDAVTTAGADADAIHAETGAGGIMVNAGPITASGANSDGVDASSAGCGDIMVTLEGDVTTPQGAAVRAMTCGAVSVTAEPDVDVAAGPVGFDLTSGTGTTVLVGTDGMLSAQSGLALNADGAAAAVTNNGMVAGRVDLTGNDDLFVNNGVFAALGTSDFGAGADRFANRGVLSLTGDAAFAGLETFANSGVIDMRSGAAGETLSLSGDYAAAADAALVVDIDLSAAGTPADTLAVAGAVSGVTPVTLNDVGDGSAALNPDGEPIVTAGALPAGAFPLVNPPADRGFVTYEYGVDAAADEARIYALPAASAFEVLTLARIATDFWRPSADAWAEQVQSARDARRTDRGVQLWAAPYYEDLDHKGRQGAAAFGRAVTADRSYSRQAYGVQIGVDLQRGLTALGVTGGVESAEADYGAGRAGEADLEGFNIGAYARHGGQTGLRAGLLVKADWYEVEAREQAAGYAGEMDGVSYGARGDVGYRIVTGALYLEPQAALDYVVTDLDGFSALAADVAYDDSETLEARWGVRIGAADGQGLFASAMAAHRWGDIEGSFSSGGFTAPLSDDGDHSWGELAVGFARDLGGAAAYAQIEAALGDVDGVAVRAGLRY